MPIMIKTSNLSDGRKAWQVTYSDTAKLALSVLPSPVRSWVTAQLDMIASGGESSFDLHLVATKQGRPDTHALHLGLGRYAVVVRTVRGLSVVNELDGRSFASYARTATGPSVEITNDTFDDLTVTREMEAVLS
jgi:hypothetical protein